MHILEYNAVGVGLGVKERGEMRAVSVVYNSWYAQLVRYSELCSYRTRTHTSSTSGGISICRCS